MNIYRVAIRLKCNNQTIIEMMEQCTHSTRTYTHQHAPADVRATHTHALWQSVCTSIHTRAHTSPTTSMCSNLGLPSNLKPHKFLIYVCSAQRINISKKIQLFRGISSSRSSRQLADGCVCARTHITHAHSAHELLVV